MMKNKRGIMNNYDRKKLLNDHLDEYTKKLNRLLSSIDIDILEKIVSRFIKAFKENKTIFIAGNGGSAATA